MTWQITGATGTGENLLYSQAGTPTLDLRFASSKSLNDYISGQNLITFTRSGNATYFDADGVIQTAGTNTARFDHDPATGESLGLLIEEQRQNLLLNSETLATQDVTVTAAAHTLSFYGTGTVTLSGTHSATVVGTGAYPTRTTLTFTPTAGTLTVTVSGTVQYANLEAGSFATSWIPTAGTTVTRNADVAQITGSNFSRWYSQSAGSVYAAINGTAAAASNYVYTLDNNTAATSIRSTINTIGTTHVLVVQNGGATQASFAEAKMSNASVKTAIGYAVNNINASIAGSVETLDTSGSVPVVSQLTIGSRHDATLQWGGCIARLTYFDRRLPDAVLQAITAS